MFWHVLPVITFALGYACCWLAERRISRKKVATRNLEGWIPHPGPAWPCACT